LRTVYIEALLKQRVAETRKAGPSARGPEMGIRKFPENLKIIEFCKATLLSLFVRTRGEFLQLVIYDFFGVFLQNPKPIMPLSHKN